MVPPCVIEHCHQCSRVQTCALRLIVKTCNAAAGLCCGTPTALFVLWKPVQAAAVSRWLCSGAGLFEVSFTPQHAAAYEAVAGCLAEGGATSRVQVGLLGHIASMHALRRWPSVRCLRLMALWQGMTVSALCQ